MSVIREKAQPQIPSTGSHYSSFVISTEYTKNVGWPIIAVTNLKIAIL